jgi:hypothetical protein
MKATRTDMFTEIASDMASWASELSYDEFHALMQPMFITGLQKSMAAEADEAVAAYYEKHLGTAPVGWENNK